MNTRELIRSKIARDTSWSLVLKVGSKGLGFALAVVLARALGADGYGIYTYAFALVTLLALPAQAGLPALLVRETAKARALDEPSLIRGVWTWAGRVAGVVSLVVSVVGAGVVFATNSGEMDAQRWTMIWALLMIPLIALGNLRGAALRGLNQIVAGQLPEYVVRPAVLLAIVGGMALFGEALTSSEAMASHLVAAAIAFALGAWLLQRRTPAAVRRTAPRFEGKAWLASALPLALIAGMTTINSSADIILLGMFEPADEVGIYRVAVQMATLAAFGLQAVNLVVAPRFARLHAQGDIERLQRLVTGSARFVLVFALVVTVVFVIVGMPLLDVVFGAVFVAAYAPALILLGGQLINSTAGSVGHLLNMTGHERDLARAVAIAAVVNISLNLALIPLWGPEGAATATAVSLIVWNSWLWVRVRRRLGINSLAFDISRPSTP